jgi:hypothetical protein
MELHHEQILPQDFMDAYMAGKKFPTELGKKYDLIGFDADHCLVKYKIKALTEMQIQL